MSEKRARKAAEEAKEAKANELIRRKAGKVRDGTRLYSRKKQYLTSPRANQSQEASQIKEDLKNKQILKDLAAKRRGSSHPLRPRSPKRETMIIVYLFIQKRRTRRRPSQRLKRRSRLTSANAPRRQRRRKHCVRARRRQQTSQGPLHLLLHHRPWRLRFPDASSRRRACRYGLRVAGSR